MITLILKATDGCNLRCTYCSIGEKNTNFTMMDVNTIKKSGDFIVKFAKERNDNVINIILHGGEPTLLPCGVYQEFFDYVSQTYPDINWRFSIQTNGYHISDGYIKIFQKYDVHVGISIDGSEKVHDYTRVDIQGKGSFCKIKDNILKLKDADVSVSALIVVTKLLLEEDLSYLNFFNYYNIPLKINPLLNYGEASNKNNIWLFEGDYAKYLIKIYNYMLDNEIEIRINPITGLFESIINNKPMSDCSYKSECGKKFICVDYKGNIYPCGRYYDIEGSCIGNIFSEQSVQEYPIGKLNEECNQCKYLKWCNGGCSAYRKIMKMDKSPLCYDIKKLNDYFRNDGITKYISYLKNQKAYLKNKLEQMEQL